MQKATIEAETSINKLYEDAKFESEKHSQEEIVKLCHGNLCCVVGRVLIQALRTVLVGANLSLIPVVKAANPEPGPPERPPKMKYKDLPIYECPHYEYKDYLETESKCPNANVKILHTYLFPKVSEYRKSWSESITEFNKDAGELKDDACSVLLEKKDEFIAFMRNKDNLMIRQAVVATSTATGFYVGRGAGLLRRLFFSTLGALASGALCFPKETDEIFRAASFQAGKLVITFFSSFCGLNFGHSFREIPCQKDTGYDADPHPDDIEAEAKKKQQEIEAKKRQRAIEDKKKKQESEAMKKKLDSEAKKAKQTASAKK